MGYPLMKEIFFFPAPASRYTIYKIIDFEKMEKNEFFL
jgi:hypothetical protein